MATKSFSTDYKFNQKSAQKLMDAMEKHSKLRKTDVNARRIKSDQDLISFITKIKK